MLVRQPAAILGQPHNLGKEQVCHLVLQQPALVLRERGVIKSRFVRVQIEEPAKQQIVLQPLAELPLRANRVECHQHLCHQQPLRRNRRPAVRRVDLVEVRVHPRQHLVQQALDRADRMIRRNHRLHVYQTRHTHLGLFFAAHAYTTIRRSLGCALSARFSTPC
jgi:hypothetical protein